MSFVWPSKLRSKNRKQRKNGKKLLANLNLGATRLSFFRTKHAILCVLQSERSLIL